MKNAICEIYTGLKSLFVGMRITLDQFLKPTITVQYPHETLTIPPRFRGHIELEQDPETGMAKCFVCKLCERACPSDCITVEGIKPEGGKRKTVTQYRLDFTKCSLCGSCVEACRDGAIRFSRDYNLAGLNKEDFIMDLFKRLQDQAEAAGTPLALPATPAPQPAVPQTQVAAQALAAAAPALQSHPAPVPTTRPAPARSPEPVEAK